MPFIAGVHYSPLTGWHRKLRPNTEGTADGASFGMNNCHPHVRGNNQLFQHNTQTKQLIIELDGKCLTATSPVGGVTATTCKSKGDPAQLYQQWTFTPQGWLQNGKNGFCATAVKHLITDGTKPVFGRTFRHSRMLSDPTPAGLKRCRACDPMACLLGAFFFLPVDTVNSVVTLKAAL
jgi:hypothetical protein